MCSAQAHHRSGAGPAEAAGPPRRTLAQAGRGLAMTIRLCPGPEPPPLRFGSCQCAVSIEARDARGASAASAYYSGYRDY